MAGKTYKTKTYDTKKIKDTLKKVGIGYGLSPANLMDMVDLAELGIKLTMKKGGSPKSTKGKSTMYKKKMASGKTVKGGKTDFDKMVKELGLSKSEIADMLGLTKRDPKTGVRRKAGKKVGTKTPEMKKTAELKRMSGRKDIRKAMTTPAKNMPYKKPAPKKKPKSMIEKQMDIVMPKQQTMKSGKRVGCGAALRGYGKAMTKKG